MKKNIFTFILIASLTVIAASCVKQKFDSPPDTTNIDPNLPVNGTIWQLKQKYLGAPVEITDDITVSGIVVADDRSGNFYKQIVVQDTSSGIVVLIGRASLYNDFPIGRKVYIKCKGLWVGAYGGFIQLGSTPDIGNALSDIPSAKISNYIVKASYPHAVTPRIVSIPELTAKTGSELVNAKWLGTLIQIDSAEIKQAEVGTPYAQDPNISSGTDRNVKDCADKTVILRNSGYASFRNVPLPAGKGPLTAIYSRYNSTAQLLIRDTSDLKMYGTRCGGVVITPPADITIDSLRKIYNGTGVKLGNYKIHGVVTSSSAEKNVSTGTAFVQDESNRGIMVYFGGAHSYVLGDSITIDCSGDSLIVYMGTLELKASAAKTTKVSSGKTINPMVVTIAQLNTDLNNATVKLRMYESMLVKVLNCNFSGGTGGKYSGNTTLTDASGTITHRTATSATFASSLYLTGNLQSVTGIANKYTTTNQLSIRKLTDVVQ